MWYGICEQLRLNKCFTLQLYFIEYKSSKKCKLSCYCLCHLDGWFFLVHIDSIPLLLFKHKLMSITIFFSTPTFRAFVVLLKMKYSNILCHLKFFFSYFLADTANWSIWLKNLNSRDGFKYISKIRRKITNDLIDWIMILMTTMKLKIFFRKNDIFRHFRIIC